MQNDAKTFFEEYVFVNSGLASLYQLMFAETD